MSRNVVWKATGWVAYLFFAALGRVCLGLPMKLSWTQMVGEYALVFAGVALGAVVFINLPLKSAGGEPKGGAV